MFHTKGEYHLAFPERDRIDECRLDFFCHHCVVSLYQTDLWCGLHGDCLGQFQIMQFFLKTFTSGIQIFCCLCILGKSACHCFTLQFLKLTVSCLDKLLLSGKHIHGQFFIICQVHFIHLVQKRNVFHKLHFVRFQCFDNIVYIGFCFCIFGFHCLDLVSAFFEDSEESFFLFLIKSFQFCHHIT